MTTGRSRAAVRLLPLAAEEHVFPPPWASSSSLRASRRRAAPNPDRQRPRRFGERGSWDGGLAPRRRRGLHRRVDESFNRVTVAVEGAAFEGSVYRAALGRGMRSPRDSTAWNETSRYRIRAEGVPVAGQVLTKVGRTTGLTQGVVSFTGVNVNVDGTNVTFLGQDLVESDGGDLIVAPGDSGAPVFEVLHGADVRVMGILWGGRTTW